jgi:phosphatidylglycerol:prolipoprotein diacylglycerol transferase
VRPILLEFAFGGREYVLGAYSTFYALAWVVAPLLGAWVASRRGLPARRTWALYAIALASGIVGARVLDLFVAGRFYSGDPSRVWSLTFQGFSLYGGLVLATLAGIVLARIWRLPVWRLADSAVPALAVGVVLMRTGCYLRGCCSGVMTDAPWGVRFPVGSPAWSEQVLSGKTGILSFVGVVQPVHPTQLYEMAAAVLLGGLALWLMRRRAADGVPFLAFALGFTLFRLGNGFLRARQDVITAPTWFYPVLYVVLAAVLTVLLALRVRTGRRRTPPPLPASEDADDSRCDDDTRA